MSTSAAPPSPQEYNYGSYCFCVEQKQSWPTKWAITHRYELRDPEKVPNWSGSLGSLLLCVTLYSWILSPWRSLGTGCSEMPPGVMLAWFGASQHSLALCNSTFCTDYHFTFRTGMVGCYQVETGRWWKLGHLDAYSRAEWQGDRAWSPSYFFLTSKVLLVSPFCLEGPGEMEKRVWKWEAWGPLTDLAFQCLLWGFHCLFVPF